MQYPGTINTAGSAQPLFRALPLILNAKTRSISARARAVDREDVIHGAEQLGLPLDTVIAEVITALKLDAERLGLAGTAHSTPP